MSENKEKKPGFVSKMITDNPVFGLYLGICSTLAISTTVNNAIGMGVGVTFVLVLSNVIVSLIAKITPDDIHIPVYIVVIATLVSILEMFMHAYTPALYTALGAFLSLIVVNCIILGRAEAFACTHTPLESAKDGIQMGAAYTCSLLVMSLIRQLLGTGVFSLSNPFTNAVICNIRIIPAGFEIPVMTAETGAFFTFACLAAAVAMYKDSMNKPVKKGAKK